MQPRRLELFADPNKRLAQAPAVAAPHGSVGAHKVPAELLRGTATD
jgi:hypothetical protein